MERYRPTIIVDKRGTEKVVVPFPDKKIASIDFTEVFDYLKEGRRLFQEFEVGQREATWNVQSQFPDLPIILHLCSDEHFGSVRVDYELWEKHMKIIKETPNTFRATNGDHLDFFNPTVHPTGMAENPLPPQMQARAYLKMLSELDRLGKLAVVGQGNHDQFGAVAGQDFYETFMHEISAPIFTEGGILNIVTTNVKYRMVQNHTFWGNSRINLTNAAKRLIEYDGEGDVDIGWVGHCFDESVEILTEDGWIKGIDLKGTERVATMNLETGLLEYNKIKEKFVYGHFKKLIRFKGRGHDISVTDQHSMVYAPSQSGHGKGLYQKCKANKKWRKTEARILAKRQGGFFIPLAVHNNNPDCPLTDDQIRLIGWLVSEGHFRKNGAVQLFQSVGKKAKIIEDLLKRLGIGFSRYLRKFAGRKFNDPHNERPYVTLKNSYTYYIPIKIGKEILEYIKEKKVPPQLQNCSERQFRILLEALCLGDGTHQSENSWVYYSKDKVLIDQIQELCVKNGYRSGIKSRRGCWEIVICNRDSVVGDGKTSKEYVDYNGKVWCVSVDNGTLVVRSKGKTIITGNTHGSAYEVFSKGGKEIVAVLSGTYKLDDKFGKKWGMGREGMPGICLMLWQDKKKIEVFKDLESAQQMLLGLVHQKMLVGK